MLKVWKFAQIDYQSSSVLTFQNSHYDKYLDFNKTFNLFRVALFRLSSLESFLSWKYWLQQASSASVCSIQLGPSEHNKRIYKVKFTLNSMIYQRFEE